MLAGIQRVIFISISSLQLQCLGGLFKRRRGGKSSSDVQARNHVIVVCALVTLPRVTVSSWTMNPVSEHVCLRRLGYWMSCEQACNVEQPPLDRNWATGCFSTSWFTVGSNSERPAKGRVGIRVRGSGFGV